MRGVSRTAGLLVSLALMAACASSDGDASSPGEGSLVETSTGASTEADSGDSGQVVVGDAGSDEASSSAGASQASFEESTDELLFTLPDGWSFDVEPGSRTLTYRIFHADNAAVEAALIADYPNAGLSSPFFSNSVAESDSIFSLSAEKVHDDARIQELGNIKLEVLRSPLQPDSTWSDSWATFADAEAFATWNWPGASEPSAREVVVAGAPGLAFVPLDYRPLQELQYVVLTPDSQQLWVQVFPNNSVHADEIAEILASVEKGVPGTRYAS